MKEVKRILKNEVVFKFLDEQIVKTFFQKIQSMRILMQGKSSSFWFDMNHGSRMFSMETSMDEIKNVVTENDAFDFRINSSLVTGLGRFG